MGAAEEEAMADLVEEDTSEVAEASTAVEGVDE